MIILEFQMMEKNYTKRFLNKVIKVNVKKNNNKFGILKEDI
jgi:hypothetical protein